MPFQSTLHIDGPVELAIVGNDVQMVLPTGRRKLTIRTSRHQASLFAQRLIKLLEDAERGQPANLLTFRRGKKV